MWYYIDTFEQIQGPYPSFQMDLWLMIGLYFTADQKIAVFNPVNWKTIKLLIENPFLFIPDTQVMYGGYLPQQMGMQPAYNVQINMNQDLTVASNLQHSS